MSTKREQILLACMGAVAIGAAGVFLWPAGPSLHDQVKLEEVQKSAQNMAASLVKLKLSKVENYILLRSGQSWSTDPFLPKPLEPAAKSGGKESGPSLVYSGFIDAGTRKLAVINGTEYQVGEQIESGDYTVADITADQVVLEEIGKKNKLVIPYQDPSFFAQ